MSVIQERLQRNISHFENDDNYVIIFFQLYFSVIEKITRMPHFPENEALIENYFFSFRLSFKRKESGGKKREKDQQTEAAR
jgi:hypothetical protein